MTGACTTTGWPVSGLVAPLPWMAEIGVRVAGPSQENGGGPSPKNWPVLAAPKVLGASAAQVKSS